MAPDRKLDLHRRVRPGERCIDVSARLFQHMRLGRARRVERAGRVFGGEHGRQVAERDRDPLRRVFGAVGAVGKHRRHRLPDIAHPAAGEDRLAVGFEAPDPGRAERDRADVGDVRCRPYRGDARRRARLPDLHGEQFGVRPVGAHDAHVKLVGERDVGDEPAGAADQRRILEAGDALSDAGPAAGGSAAGRFRGRVLRGRVSWRPGMRHPRSALIAAATAFTASRMLR